MPEKQAKKPSPQRKGGKGSHVAYLQALSVALLVLAGITLVGFGASAYVEWAYQEKIFPGVFAGTVELSGLTRTQAQTLLQERIAQIETAGISATYNDESIILESTVVSEDAADAAFPLYIYEQESILDAAMQFGRSSNALANSIDRLAAIFSARSLNVPVDFDTETFVALLQDHFGDAETQPTNADLAMATPGTFAITESKSGEVFPYEAYAASALDQLVSLTQPTITLALAVTEPPISQVNGGALIPMAEAVYAEAPFTLTWEDKTWELPKEEVAKSLHLAMVNNQPSVVFSESGMEATLGQIKSVTDIEAKDAKFTIANGKVQEFQSSSKGRTVDVAALLAALNQRIISLAKDPIPLAVKEVEPAVTASDADSLGIKEMVGKGQTNFKGSPTNRRKNIANGVRLLNGTLIKPGETFSLVKALSPIETSNGYFSELVIKGNRTIPEVGGGLCQIGTTAFRVVLNAGLPVVERRNHSYRVSYYEPPVGMDATIYDPKPDFQFTNDYGSHLLLTARVEGDELIFELWGTEDGRVAESTTPKMYNVTSPGPTKYIESDDLAPGEQKCIEKAHNGATAEFTYTVTYKSGEVKQETFVSKYKAWQAVCLVGKAAT